MIQLRFYTDIRRIPPDIFEHCARHLGVPYGAMRSAARLLRSSCPQDASGVRGKFQGPYPAAVALKVTPNQWPVGWIVVDELHLAMMYVLEPYRRLGLASKMLATLMRRHPWPIDVYHGNTYATPTYQRACRLVKSGSGGTDDGT